MFRGEENTVFKPAIMDDYNPKTFPAEMQKSMLNPAEEDALLWARWGGAGFASVRHHDYKTAKPSKAA